MKRTRHTPEQIVNKFRKTRVMFDKEATETIEVIDFQPGKSYTLRVHNCGCEYRPTVGIRPFGTGRGSEITFDFAATPLTFGAEVMNTLVGWMMKGAFMKAVRIGYADPKAAAENIAAETSAAH